MIAKKYRGDEDKFEDNCEGKVGNMKRVCKASDSIVRKSTFNPSEGKGHLSRCTNLGGGSMCAQGGIINELPRARNVIGRCFSRLASRKQKSGKLMPAPLRIASPGAKQGHLDTMKF